ncbi:MAG: Uma2 family endonuclease [Dehalococcoidia bacterium]|nr:Uma2 family endonuclease [Dehalococcoidia bacterium]
MATSHVENVVLSPELPDSDLSHPVSVNIRPILESVAGKLSDHEIDQWLVGCAQANEGRGFYLELTSDGELVINPMVNMDGYFAEADFGSDLVFWSRRYGGRAAGAGGIIRLPDGTRVQPDAAWLSPEQMELLMPITSRAITLCPVFVAEIMSGTDTLPPLQRKMERYIVNGAQLAWLIDPYRRRVYIYRPDIAVEVLEEPEIISGDPVMPGFVFEVRRRIFSLHETDGDESDRRI